MSDKRIRLRIVTPDKVVIDAPVEAVGAMGSEGAFTALPGHLPFLTDLKPGLLWYRREGQTRDLAVSGGFIEITPDQAHVLADSAEYLDDIDVERAQRALKRAEERLARARAEARDAEEGRLTDISRATASLNRAATRIKLVARRMR
ncbi:MAG: F0F1 ATP synthase subunit epsilon [Candidatus Adiutrix sp.]|nr:F0F1 ATP synthase subunit epsilon [Candidatus Adiutrix sp.]